MLSLYSQFINAKKEFSAVVVEPLIVLSYKEAIVLFLL